MNKKLAFTGLVVAAALIIGLSGCKSNGSEDHAANTPPPPKHPTSTPTPPAQSQPHSQPVNPPSQPVIPPPQPVIPPPKVDAPPAPAEPPAADKGDQPSQIRKYEGPPVKVTMLQLQTYPPQNNVGVEIKVNTGGWTLELDRGVIVDKVAQVYFTLERPADGELVTQSLVTLQGNFKTLEEITSSEIYIHLAKRGESTLTTDYRLAAKGK